jgi:hypothetical protein
MHTRPESRDEQSLPQPPQLSDANEEKHCVLHSAAPSPQLANTVSLLNLNSS